LGAVNASRQSAAHWGGKQTAGEKAMQIRALVVMVAAALLLGGCAGDGGLFRDRDERDAAARLLLQRQANEEAALLEDEAEAEAAREAQNKRALQALQEADEDAERRKREEAADFEQERRHRRELKEAEHDAKIRELHKGSAAPPPEVERNLIAGEKYAAAYTEWAHELSYCARSSETVEQAYECRNERERRLRLKQRAAGADATNSFGRALESLSPQQRLEFPNAGEYVQRAAEESNVAGQAANAAVDAYNDAVRAWHRRPSSHAAKRRYEAAQERLLEAVRRYADAEVTLADEWRAAVAKKRAIVENWNWNTGSAPQTETTSAAAQNAQPAKAPQRADSNCYDGTMMLIRPNETLRDWESRCEKTQQSTEAADGQAEAIEAAKRTHAEQ